jgi:hypothetical protein
LEPSTEILVNVNEAAKTVNGRPRPISSEADALAAASPDAPPPAMPWSDRPDADPFDLEAHAAGAMESSTALDDAPSCPGETSCPPNADGSAPVRQATREPLRARHDELLAGLGRRFQAAALKLDFEVRTTATRQIFRRDFVYVSRQLHGLEASRRVQGLDRALLNDALSAVERRANGVRTLLLQVASDTRELVALHGQSSVEVAVGRPARLQATIVSPWARVYVEMLALADEALIQLEKAWLLGLLDSASRSRRASDCRQALQGYKEFVRQQRHLVGEHVRGVNAARRGLKELDVDASEGIDESTA